MPIYEFYCPDNNTVYRFFARRTGLDQKVPRCPVNPKFRMEKRVSSFAIVGATDKAKKEGPEGAGAEDDMLDDPRMEKMMMELEGEMSGLDDDNPDPRHLGRLMRRMKDLMGENGQDARMDEMIRRLESGEDPDKMEEDYADLLDEGPDGGGTGEAGDAATEGRKLLARWRKARRTAGPRIDPELYEMDEWLDEKAKKLKR